MEKNHILPQKYIELGFNMSKFGNSSLALRCQNNVVFVFNSSIDIREDFVSRLCDCHIKLISNGIIKNRN
jgi:hypothetical protein